MARRTKWGIREKIASVWVHRGQMVNTGRWTVRKLLAGVSADDALEVFDIDTGQSIMALTQNDRSEYRPWDIGYFTKLHNLFPEVSKYIDDLEMSNRRLEIAAADALTILEMYRDGSKAAPPPEILEELATALAAWTAEAARHRVPTWSPPLTDRRRAIRISPHDGTI